MIKNKVVRCLQNILQVVFIYKIYKSFLLAVLIVFFFCHPSWQIIILQIFMFFLCICNALHHAIACLLFPLLVTFLQFYICNKKFQLPSPQRGNLFFFLCLNINKISVHCSLAMILSVMALLMLLYWALEMLPCFGWLFCSEQD